MAKNVFCKELSKLYNEKIMGRTRQVRYAFSLFSPHSPIRGLTTAILPEGARIPKKPSIILPDKSEWFGPYEEPVKKISSDGSWGGALPGNSHAYYLPPDSKRLKGIITDAFNPKYREVIAWEDPPLDDTATFFGKFLSLHFFTMLYCTTVPAKLFFQGEFDMTLVTWPHIRPEPPNALPGRDQTATGKTPCKSTKIPQEVLPVLGLGVQNESKIITVIFHPAIAAFLLGLAGFNPDLARPHGARTTSRPLVR